MWSRNVGGRCGLPSAWREDGPVAEPFDVAEFRAFILQEIARWKPMLEPAGFAAQ